MPAARALAVLLVTTALTSAGCGPDPDPPEPTATPTPTPPPASVADEPWPDPGDGLVIEVAPGRGPPSFVTRPPKTTVEIVTAAGGEITTSPGPSAGTGAAVFPDAAAAARGALATLRVELVPPSRAFAPGAEDFAIGVDVLLPAPATRGTVDNGDNLLQRGLFGDVGQLKLQADGGRPSCRVAGSQGDVDVGSKLPLDSRVWYRLRCQRTADAVTLYVGRLGADGSVDTWDSWTEPGAVGDISFADDVAVSVGGKLNPQGGLVPDNPDQFNGSLTRLVYFLH